ncbi:putative ATPase/DNA-binding XRE family transcriptional regulator [Allocatelliglobosispora scoriae]|uniref:Putative ATPase/DNA-binding XRE family transcriptional regulator n=1 Tax=Allocatelliglobosispora scoriae TaxID=643052 RepID=A0A841BYZ1_9ACTN|nr:helix-turn-helix domain-containing protein [Allocatelliglobosispora scoriae]MBB5874357.1 putative ATPase/DNA-binding XRE family transcriptional regulator [Allocatelliglobosispora scoriae]
MPSTPVPGSLPPLAESLVRLRRAARLSQRALAERTGLSERAIRDLEKGVTTRPHAWSLRAIADALGLDDRARQALLDAAAERPPAVPQPFEDGDPMVGRSAELARLADLVQGRRHRLVTLTGAGGMGKSRLAAELAAHLRRVGTEVAFVDLSALDDPALVGEVVAESVRAGGRSRLDPVSRIAAELRGSRLVLVLDGFERLLDAATVVARLVAACPALSVVVTSRLPLRVASEREFRLDPLPVPGPDEPDIAEMPSVRLLLARTRHDFTLTPQNAGAVAAICRAVEGLPLGLELAAARLRVLSPQELLDRLAQPLAVLSGNTRDAPPRHRSLRAAIESSLDVLGGPSRHLFTSLGAFPAGVRLADLEEITARDGTDPGLVLGALADLADASLIRLRAEPGGTRYTLPDAMRELAAEQLALHPDAVTLRGHVSGHYLGRVRAAAQRPDGSGYADLEPDRDNVRAAVTWSRHHHPAVFDLATVDALYRLFELRGRFAEGRATLTALADAAVPARSRALVRAGRLSHHVGDLETARDLGLQAQQAAECDDHEGQALAGMLLGSLAIELDPAQAQPILTQALGAAKAHGEDGLIGRALNNLAAATANTGDLPEAQRLMREALQAKRRAGASDVDTGRTLMNLAELALADGRWLASATHGSEAATVLGRAEDPRLQAYALSIVAVARLRESPSGDTGALVALATRAVELLDRIGEDRSMRGLVRARFSVVLRGAGEVTRAIEELTGAAESLRGGCLPYQVAPVIESHAELIAPADPETAALLLGLATAMRGRTATTPPSPVDRYGSGIALYAGDPASGLLAAAQIMRGEMENTRHRKIVTTLQEL